MYVLIICPHRLLAAYDAIQHVRQYHMLARQAFSGWLCHQQRRRRKKQQWQRAATHRELLRMQGKPLLFWLHWMRVERYARVCVALNLLPWYTGSLAKMLSNVW